MDGKRLGGLGGLLVIIILGGVWRWHSRGEDSDTIKTDAMMILSTMDGYDANKAVLDEMAERAHTSAFNASYQAGGRRRRAQFDDDKYLDLFFRSMVSQAEQKNRLDLKQAILDLRAFGDAPYGDGSVDPSGAEDGNSSVSGAAEPGSRPSIDLASLPDDRLDDEVFERISGPILALPAEEWPGAVKKLSKSRRMIFLTRMYEAEVGNGGYGRFFSCATGMMSKETVLAFNLIRAKKNAKLLRRAIAVFVRSNPQQETIKVDKTIKGYLKKYKDEDLAALEGELLKLKEDLAGLRVAYIRTHLDEFASP